MINTIELPEVKVMCIKATSTPAKAFMELERVVPLKGRKFYGVKDNQTNEYFACVKMEEGDDFKTLGLEAKTLSGGLYAYKKIEGKYAELIMQIAPTFQEMVLKYNFDRTRPSIEFYKRFNEFILYLPITR